MTAREDLLDVLRSGPAARTTAPRAPGRGGALPVPLVVVALLGLLLGIGVLGLTVGSVPVPWGTTWKVLAHRVGGDALVAPTGPARRT